MAQTFDVLRVLQQAVILHQQGRLAEAEPLYRAVLNLQPDHFDALHFLGVVKLQQSSYDEAAVLISRALRTRPNSPDALSNRAIALQALNRHEEAVANYNQAIAIKPDYVDALFNRGNALHALGRHKDALASYDQALALRSEFAAAHSNRGNVLQSLNRHGEAIASYDKAIAIRPEHADALNNRGNAAHALGRNDDAVADYDRALALNPDYPEALTGRGNTLSAMSRHAEAIADYDRALAIRPDFADALYARGFALQALNRHEEAIADFERMLALKPDCAEAHHSRGNALTDRNRYDEALASYDRALALDPDAKYVMGDAAYIRARLCDWRDYDRVAQRLLEGVSSGKLVSVPFVFLVESEDPLAQLACAVSCVSDRYPAVLQPMWNGERYSHDKIRVAYLSADFHDHAMAYLMAELFERHDRQRFEISGISFGRDKQDEMRSRLIAGFDRFIDVRGQGDADAARLLREREIDITVDLMGFTEGARPRILAHRPAPIQVNYLGYPGTMGAPYIDYIVADEFVIPNDDRACYSEQVVYLPDCYQVNDSKRKIAERTPTRSEVGLPEDGFVFCCFNNHYKITPGRFDVWMRLLQRVERSVLWLLRGDASAERNLRAEAQTRGVDPKRLVFAPKVGLQAHLARHRLADLFVDTLPYNAHTTASDALWAGLPVLTCAGGSFAGRVAGSLLRAVGLPELVTNSLHEYEDMALMLASQPTLLGEIKAKLARNRLSTPLFDTDRFRQHIEAAYLTMWETYQRGDKPASFAVVPLNTS